MAVAAVMTVGSLCSCGGDDNNDGGGSSEATYVSGTVINSFLTTDRTLDAYDVTVTYKDVKGNDKVYTFNKDKATVLKKEEAAEMGLGVALWYATVTGTGKTVYICNAGDNLTVPSNVNYSFGAKFTFKGENAKTQEKDGKEYVGIDYHYFCYVGVKLSNGKSAIQSQLDSGNNLSTALEKAEGLAETASKTYDFSVALTSTEFVPKRINNAAAAE